MAGLGNPRTGGRAKGTPNRGTAAFIARMDELREQGLECPITVLMELASGRKLNGERMLVNDAVRVRAAAALLEYVFPKRKAVELSGSEGTQITFAVVQDDDTTPAYSQPQ